MDKKEIIKTAIEICLKKYNLKDDESISIFTDIAYNSIDNHIYNSSSNLNEEIFIKQNIINDIDKYIINKSRTDNIFYKILEQDLMKTLNTTCRIRKEKFENIEDVDYYKEWAILKAIETYDENITKSINLYVNDWFMAFINKTVDEESKTLVLK